MFETMLGVFGMSTHPPTSAESGKTPFPYETLLAFCRGEIPEGSERTALEERLRDDPRWQAHWQSVRYLDLERTAANQDAKDLANFEVAKASAICRNLARSGDTVNETEVLLDHADSCVFCRRFLRRVRAKAQERTFGEPLLRDWLLSSICERQLEHITRQLLSTKMVVTLNSGLFEKATLGDFVTEFTEPDRREVPGLSWFLTPSDFATASAEPFRIGTGFRGEGTANERAKLPKELTFLRKLGDARGKLKVLLRLSPPGLSWVVEWDRGDEVDPPFPEVVLEVTFDGNTHKESGTSQYLQVEGTLEQLEPSASLTATIRLTQNEEVWEEFNLEIGG